MTAPAARLALAAANEHPDVHALAIHEAAHTVAALRGRGRVRKVELIRGSTPDRWRGITHCAFDESPEGHWASIVTSLAAVPAEQQFAGSDPDRRERVRWVVHSDPTGDLAAARTELDQLPRHDRPTLRQAERAAAVLVERNWQHIEHLAELLLTTPGHTIYNVRI